GGDDLGVAERRVVLVEVQVAGKPDSRRIAQQRGRARDIQVARAVDRKVDVAHRLEGRADHDAEGLADRLDEDENPNAGRDVVRVVDARRREHEPRRNDRGDNDVDTWTDPTPTA